MMIWGTSDCCMSSVREYWVLNVAVCFLDG